MTMPLRIVISVLAPAILSGCPEWLCPVCPCAEDTSAVRDFVIINKDEGGPPETWLRALRLSNWGVAVQFEAGLTEPSRDAVIAAHPVLLPYSQRRHADAAAWDMLAVKACTARAAVWATILALRQAPGVAVARPVFEYGANRMIAGDDLTVIFKAGASGDAIGALHAANGVEVTNESTVPGGRIRQVLRVPAGDAVGALDMANRYFFSGIADAAEASFFVFDPFGAS